MCTLILLKWRLPFALPGGSLDLNWSEYIVFFITKQTFIYPILAISYIFSYFTKNHINTITWSKFLMFSEDLDNSHFIILLDGMSICL